MVLQMVLPRTLGFGVACLFLFSHIAFVTAGCTSRTAAAKTIPAQTKQSTTDFWCDDGQRESSGLNPHATCTDCINRLVQHWGSCLCP